jgi:hypothetical protein
LTALGRGSTTFSAWTSSHAPNCFSDAVRAANKPLSTLSSMSCSAARFRRCIPQARDRSVECRVLARGAADFRGSRQIERVFRIVWNSRKGISCTLISVGRKRSQLDD